jgi:hypothetical protein
MGTTSVKDTMNEVFEGMVYGKPLLQETVISSELVYFGKAVSLAATDNIDSTTPKAALFTDTETFYGVAIGEPTLEALPDPFTGLINSAPYGAHAANHGMTVVRKGKIWVWSDTAITSRALGVYVRDEDSLGTAATVTSTTCTEANLDGDDFDITISGYAVQNVVFAAPASDAAVANQINAQISGAIAVEASGDIVITTILKGDTMTIAATDIGSDLVWDTPVAGTGDAVQYAHNARGSFRAYTTSQSVAGFTEISTKCAWRAGKTVGGKYFGLLEVAL